MIMHRRTPSGGSSSTGSSNPSSLFALNPALPMKMLTASASTTSSDAQQQVAARCDNVEEAAAKFDAFRGKLLPAASALREMYESAVKLNETRRETARLFQSFLEDSPLANVAGDPLTNAPEARSMDDRLAVEGAPPSLRRGGRHATAGAASVCSEATTVQVDNRAAAGGGSRRAGVAREAGSAGLSGRFSRRGRRKDDEWKVGVIAGPQDVDAILEEETGTETAYTDAGQGAGRALNKYSAKDESDLQTHQTLCTGGADDSAAPNKLRIHVSNHVHHSTGVGRNKSESKDKHVKNQDAETRAAAVDTGGSYIEVHEEAFLVTHENVDRYLLSASRYIEEWDKVVNTRVQGRIFECRRLKNNLDRYDRKIKGLRAKAGGVDIYTSSPGDRPKLHTKLERNELKLSGAREAYDSYSEGLFLLVEEITERGWMDIYPVLLKVLRFDARCNSDCAQIFSRLSGAIDILADLGVRHKLSATGRLGALKSSRPAELFTGQKLINHRVCTVNHQNDAEKL